jgi:hypothetical protein
VRRLGETPLIALAYLGIRVGRNSTVQQHVALMIGAL